MGMYTELIFGASLKEETPKSVINTLKYMIGDLDTKPEDFELPEGRCGHLLRSGSYYFGVNKAVSKIWKDNISGQYHISSRSNLKNYGGEIEIFLNWIKPYVCEGSGLNDMYAIVIYEEQATPDIYYLEND